MAGIYVLHENDAWVEPLRAALAELGLAHDEWFLDSGCVDLAAAPPEGVFYNRMSASSHSRGHRWGPEHAATVLAWLESHGRTVVNGWRAVQLEVSKTAQYGALARFGVTTPRQLAQPDRVLVQHLKPPDLKGRELHFAPRGARGNRSFHRGLELRGGAVRVAQGRDPAGGAQTVLRGLVRRPGGAEHRGSALKPRR